MIRKLFCAALSFICFSFQAQIITTVAGTGTSSYSGNGGPATSATISHPVGITHDAIGNIYFAELDNHVIRKIDTAGIISTVAGTGSPGYSGDGGLATQATLQSPTDVTFDKYGNMYIADGNYVIRKINTSGIISTVAGNINISTSYTNGVPATSSSLNSPWAIAVDLIGNLYIADQSNFCIRKVDTSGIINLFAGNGIGGYTGDGGLADSAAIDTPDDITTDDSGNVYIDIGAHQVIRKVNTLGIITTVIGTSGFGHTGDGGPANQATLQGPAYIQFDQFKSLYIVEQSGFYVRKVNRFGIISTVTGNGLNADVGDGGPALNAGISNSDGVTIDNKGNIYICEFFNNKIRRISGCIASATDSIFNISPLNWGILPHYSPQITNAVWNWGDGTSTMGLYPSHTYTTGGWYNICVTAYASCGDSINICSNDSIYRNSNANSIVNINVVSNVNNINSITKNNSFSIYPNPTDGTFKIETNATEKQIIDLFDINGKHVLSKSIIGTTDVEVNNLDNGIYTLSIKNTEGVTNRKLIIAK